MRILVIGGSGFIGSRLASLCGHDDITNFDLTPTEDLYTRSIIGDVRDYNSISDAVRGHDIVVLLAAEHRDDVHPAERYYDTNVAGTKNVLRAMTRCGVNSLVFTSSVAVYGSSPRKICCDDMPTPQTHYGKSKLEAESLITDWYHKNESVRTVNIVRPVVVFGEGNRGNAYNLFNQIWRDRFVMIGSGNNKKSMAYVGNIAAFLRYLLSSSGPGINRYIYADTPDFTMNELVDSVRRKLGKHNHFTRIPYLVGVLAGVGADCISSVTGQKLPVSVLRIKKFCTPTEFESNACTTTDFRPRFSLAEGLGRTLLHDFPIPLSQQAHEDSSVI